MLLTYIFYFIALASIMIIISDISTWKMRVHAARELLNSDDHINLAKDWTNLQPIIQQHIMYASYQKYGFMFFCMVGLMSSQWIFFLGLITFKIIFGWLHAIIGSKWKGTYFNDILLPIAYRLVIILVLCALVINRFHYKFLDI